LRARAGARAFRTAGFLGAGVRIPGLRAAGT
jgi:hypothetical protein